MTKIKEYKKPLVEITRLMAEKTFMANTVIQDEWADAKSSSSFDFSEEEEAAPTDDLWSTNSWSTGNDDESDGD